MICEADIVNAIDCSFLRGEGPPTLYEIGRDLVRPFEDDVTKALTDACRNGFVDWQGVGSNRRFSLTHRGTGQIS